MKKQMIATVMLSCLFVLSGCTQSGGVISQTPDSTPTLSPTNTPDPAPGSAGATPDITAVSKRDAIPFEEGQLYAAAYLGYRSMDSLGYYADRYLDSDRLPIHYVSDGDYYLVIPRYNGMSLSLYVNDIVTSLSTLRFQDPDCGPFIIQCNVSDIFPDVTARLEYNGEAAEFSPFISLKDGTLTLGGQGLDLTTPDAATQAGAEADPPH